MHAEQAVSHSALTILKWSLFIGILFAVFGGLGFETAGHNMAVQAKGPAAVAHVRPVFSPLFSLVGFIFGATVGSLIGLLWLRGGVGHAAAVLLVAGVGGMIGLACAAFFGAETKTTIIGNSIETEHGAPLLVMVVGAMLGIIIGAFGAWWLSRPSGRKRLSQA
jgi:hypothetical protein